MATAISACTAPVNPTTPTRPSARAQQINQVPRAPSATVTGKFLQLDFVSCEQEQHSESQLPKCFKSFADGRQTRTVRADQHAESEE